MATAMVIGAQWGDEGKGKIVDYLAAKADVVVRSQGGNKENALRLLKSQLYEMELRKRREKEMEIESKKKKIEWGSQIRSYVLQPYKLVKDLRTNFETGNVNAVLDGDLDGLIKAYLMEYGGM